jgi:myo-inositol-1(or 4)-monophosphatase
MIRPVDVAVEAAQAAGEIQRERAGNFGRVEYKGASDPVTEVDLLCEAEIIRRIQAVFPGHAILAEESGTREGAVSSSNKWIIDPLDGTLNYSHGYPCYCVSIGFEEDGEVTVGVVYNSCLDELFVAEKGKGATLNGRPIQVSKVDSLENSFLVTGFSPKVIHSAEDNLDHFCRFMKASQAVRRPGSAVLDLCYTAMGRFEGFWEMKLGPWDMAAGSLIVKEAGGRVTQFDGSPFSTYGKEMLATNGHIHQSMVDILQRYRK